MQIQGGNYYGSTAQSYSNELKQTVKYHKLITGKVFREAFIRIQDQQMMQQVFQYLRR